MTCNRVFAPAQHTPSNTDLRLRIQAEVFGKLEGHLQRLDWDASTVGEFQRNRLRDLLEFAIGHSAYHRQRLAGVDHEQFEPADLTQLPIMTKDDMMANFDDVVTDSRVNLAVVEEALRRADADVYPLLGEYTCLTTGGSSGQRGVFVSDVKAMAEFVSLNMRSAFGRAMRNGPQRRQPTIAFVAASAPIHGTACVPQIMAGSPIKFVNIPVTLALPEIVERLNLINPTALHSYPSMLAVLAREQEAGRLTIAPASVTATSENLEPAHRGPITAAFGAPLINNFACTEGLVGASEPGGAPIIFGSDGCIVEIVDDDFAPVPIGTPGSRVLITNLYNKVQPLIRYVLNDSFTRQLDAASDGHLRATVNGRADGVLHYPGADIHPAILMSDIWKHPEVIDFQVAQTRNGIAVTVQAVDDVQLDSLRHRLHTTLVGAGLIGAEVDIAALPTLPRNVKTGKLRRFVPLTG